MELVFHGGKCCGIKTIYGFPDYPTDLEEEIVTAKKSADRNHDRCGDHIRSDLPFFTLSAPEETAEARLRRYIDFCKERRPAGCIEVTLISKLNSPCACGVCEIRSQAEIWEPLLFELGFHPVTAFKNSNSGNEVTIYHLVYDAIPAAKTENPFAAAAEPVT